MGLNKDLKLTGNDFTNAATAFFIAYLIAEVPNGGSLALLQNEATIFFLMQNAGQVTSFRKCHPQNGSPSMSSSGGSQPPALPPQPLTTLCSSLASFLVSLKPLSPHL